MEAEGIASNIFKDHWAFLDEIEAPMWVDLTLEAKSNYQEIDDGWFNTSHMFHRCSSLLLKAAFANSGESSASSDIIDLKGPSSPKLPSSVSRSRGKHYASKAQAGKSHTFSLNKKHPVKALSGKSSGGNLGFNEEIKPKLSFINSKGTLRSKTSLVVERDLTRNAKEYCFKTIHGNGDYEGSLIRSGDKASESNTSTITCENDQKLQQRKLEISSQAKNLEVSSQASGYSSGLVSALRISLRKSCVTQQASRVYVGDNSRNNNRGRQSRDRNSVSGNSSVGSSSNPRYDVKRPIVAVVQHREQSSNSRNEAAIIRITKSKVKDSHVSKASNVQGKGRNSNSKREVTSIASKSTQKEAVNSKVQSKTIYAKPLLPHRVNKQCSLTGATKTREKVTICGPSRMIGAGGENSTGRVPLNQKSIKGDIATGVMARGQKATKQNVRQKDDKTRHSKGQIGSPSRVKHSTNATQRVYLR